MTNRFRSHLDDQSGFTLIELLVVVLIIGILAAIALPSFLGQQAKGQDTDAKADARNALSQMESCYVEKSSYVGCDDALLSAAGIDTSSTTSTKVTGQTADAFVITSISRSRNVFTITKTSGTGVVARACSTTGGTTKGGCTGSSW